MQETNSIRSVKQFAVPNFFRGVARALDLGSTFDIYKDYETSYEADMQAIASDWQQVGLVLSEAMEPYENEQK